jgi:hypothetical protein
VVGALLSFPGGAYLAGLDEITKQDLGTVEQAMWEENASRNRLRHRTLRIGLRAGHRQRPREPNMPLAIATGLGIGLGVLYVILLLTLGIMSIRKGHWVMFIIGIFFPLFWLIGALMPARQPD